MGSYPDRGVSVSDLPFHPTIPGLQAIGIGKRGNPWWPVMGASEDHDGGAGDGSGGAGGEQQPPAVGEQSGASGDLGFPANTPIKDMTVDQQVAYWKHHDRRKGDTLKSYGGITPEQAKQYQQQVQEFERGQMTPAEQALAAARDEATTAATQAAAGVWAPEVAKAVVGQFISDQEQRDAVLSGINPMAFMKDGKFDTDALIGHLTGLATAFGGASGSGDSQPRQWGQSGGTPPPKSGRDEGKAEAKRRGYIKD
ncbi:hypothetical protein [Mycolicibacterium porcinum]